MGARSTRPVVNKKYSTSAETNGKPALPFGAVSDNMHVSEGLLAVREISRVGPRSPLVELQAAGQRLAAIALTPITSELLGRAWAVLALVDRAVLRGDPQDLELLRAIRELAERQPVKTLRRARCVEIVADFLKTPEPRSDAPVTAADRAAHHRQAQRADLVRTLLSLDGDERFGNLTVDDVERIVFEARTNKTAIRIAADLSVTCDAFDDAPAPSGPDQTARDKAKARDEAVKLARGSFKTASKTLKAKGTKSA
jgi:hypothetical protein